MKKISAILIVFVMALVLCGCKPKHEHSYSSSKVEATCTEQGYTAYTCECGDTYEDNYVPVKGHSFGSWQVVTEATEEAEGLQERVCVCGEKETETLPKLEHVHKFGEWKVVTEATEETKGLKERACECGEKETEEIPLLNHTHEYKTTIVAPTCTEKGYTEHVCKCGESYKDAEVAAKGHEFGEWKVVTEATEEAEGLKERACECGEKETEVLPKLEHVHKYGEWQVVTEPTYEKEGLKERACGCGEKETEELPKLVDTEAPVISFETGETVKLNTFKDFDKLAGVTATDNLDGDLTASITVSGEVDNTTRGQYELVYTVEDSSGNKATATRTVEVIWDYATSFIGHGGSYYGVMNSEEAILYAASVLKYQAIEIDVRVTKDGVFVLCHDATFGGVTIASTNYADLKDVVHTTTKSGSGTYPLLHKEFEGNKVYKSTICTLERYLEICKQYDVRPVIELKGGTGLTNSDQSNMGRLMKEIEDAGMLEKCILLGSAYNCLIWTRENGYENVECQYLVDSCANQTYLDRCIKYNLDISMCVTYGNGLNENTPEWIAKYQDAGCKISTYTFTQYTDYSDVQKWIDLGVDFVTVDWHTMSKLKHIENSSLNIHTVTFQDKDGNILKEAKVKDGRAAPAPKIPEIPGYKFTGWDKDISKITEDLVVTAQYEMDEYTISFEANLDKVNEKTWATKADFLNDFYNDFFAWLSANVDTIPYLTYSDGTYKVVRNTSSNGTATFTSVEDLKKLNLYVFESALSSLIYKPITGSNSDDYVPEVDENYFLNSEPYRTKYLNMNKYLLGAINKSYTSYSKTFAQASNNRVQIFFRFHQWAGGTNIPAFDAYPTYYEVVVSEEKVTVPEDKTYTIVDEFDLPAATGENLEFVGWYLDKECTKPISKLEKGSTGDITLYAKWK